MRSIYFCCHLHVKFLNSVFIFFSFNSTPTSPSEIRCGRTISPTSITSGVISPTPNAHQLGCVRTSRSEDHLQVGFFYFFSDNTHYPFDLIFIFDFHVF